VSPARAADGASAAHVRAIEPRGIEPGEAIPWRRLVVLGAIALALGLAALWTIPSRLAPPPIRTEQPLVAIDPAAVRELDLESGNLEARIVRDGTGWRATGPALGGGQTIAGGPVDDFLDAVRSVPRLTQFVESDLVPFGLAPPLGKVTIRADGREATIAVGDRNPALTALYVQLLPDPAVVLVGSVVYWEFDKLVGSVRREAERADEGAEAAVAR
jgi:hypothetical protein